MSAQAEFMTRWKEWSARFAALQQREKTMVIGATLFAILFGGYSLWIEPAQLQKTRFKKTVEQQQAEQAQLATQLAGLAARASDPDAPNRRALEQAARQMAEAENELRDFDRMLVPPSQAPVLLQALLARHRGLTLVSLNTLAPQPLVAVPGAEAAQAVPVAGNLYKHGIEIKISGGYHDLLAYVAELESGQQKLLWGGMSLSSNYPVSELTLTVYTLSLESAWLVV